MPIRQQLNLWVTQEIRLHPCVFQQITHPDDMIASMEMVNLLINGKQETFELTKRYMTTFGNVWALVRVNAIRDEHGKLECYISHIIPVLGCTDDVMRDVFR